MKYRGFGGLYSPGPAGRKRMESSDIDSTPVGATKELFIEYNYDNQGWTTIADPLQFPGGSDPPGDITVQFRIGSIVPAVVAPFQIRWYNPWSPDVFDLDVAALPSNPVSRVINVPVLPTEVPIWADGADVSGSGMSSGEDDIFRVDEGE